MTEEEIQKRFAVLEELQQRTDRVLARQHIAMEGFLGMFVEQDKLIGQQREMSAIDRERIDRLSMAVSELADKLNGVIGFLDNREK